MCFKLSVISYHRYTSGLDVALPLINITESNPYYIGRSELCQWCLPDPERVISGRHALIEKRSGKTIIKDISINGVFINRNVEPLGNEGCHVLSVGDLITFGDYEIEVQLYSNETKEQLSDNVEDTKITGSDKEFGIPSKELADTFSSHKDKQISIENEVFIGDIEDSFSVPKNENEEPHSESFDESIPEDWGNVFNNNSDESRSPGKQIEPEQEQFDDVSVLSEPVQKKEKSHEETVVHHIDIDEDGALSAFLRGMKISPTMLPTEQTEVWWFEMGESVHLLLTGLMDTLQKRADFKQSNRLLHTSFKRQENNPLKFSANFEDAIHNLYHRKSSSFLSSQRAIQEAFSDIDKHEKAMISGVHGAVKGVMQALNPDGITTNETDEGLFERWYSLKKKANYWQCYESLFYELENELKQEKPFYLDDFIKHYEASLKGIREK